ncbi:MAG: hypothetical protein OQK46_06265 [Gammaproteobacteria bacterium]|nr:hypothetical protein [Gammaproteobacteria bacterium]
MLNSNKKVLVYTLFVLSVSIAYFVYASIAYPPVSENESFLSEVGEGFGEIGLWLLLFIYARTVLKLMIRKGRLSSRILPEYFPSVGSSVINKLLCYLDRTHIYFGIAAVAVILLHIVLMGIPMDILFFPAVLILVVWQALFGLFLTWKYSPKQLKKLSYLVHAQFLTGIMLGIFSYFGHLLID